MTIGVRFMGQIGNQLFQVVMGNILATRTGQIYRPPNQWLNKRGQPVNWNGPPIFPLLENSGIRGTGRTQEFSFTHYVDFTNIEPKRPVFFKYGYYQRYELLKPYKTQIRQQWLPLGRPYVNTDPDAVYIHVRRADYVPFVDNPNNPNAHCLASAINEYRSCLDHFPDAKRLVIVTDDPNDPFHREFDQLGLPWAISGLTWDGDFMLLASCRWMIMSQSTYSWWAGFLGRAERIACPMFPGTFWRHGVGLYGPAYPDYPNLYVDDEPERWFWIDTQGVVL